MALTWKSSIGISCLLLVQQFIETKLEASCHYLEYAYRKKNGTLIFRTQSFEYRVHGNTNELLKIPHHKQEFNIQARAELRYKTQTISTVFSGPKYYFKHRGKTYVRMTPRAMRGLRDIAQKDGFVYFFSLCHILVYEFRIPHYRFLFSHKIKGRNVDFCVPCSPDAAFGFREVIVLIKGDLAWSWRGEEERTQPNIGAGPYALLELNRGLRACPQLFMGPICLIDICQCQRPAKSYRAIDYVIVKDLNRLLARGS